MAMRDRERGTVFWSFGYPENIDHTKFQVCEAEFIPKKSKKCFRDATRSNPNPQRIKHPSTPHPSTRLPLIHSDTPTKLFTQFCTST